MTLAQQLAHAFLDHHPADAAQALERMPNDRRVAVVREAPELAAGALERMTATAAAECLAQLTAEEAAPVLARVPVDAAIPLLRRLSAGVVERLLSGLAPDRQDSLRRVLNYPEGTAGALMDPAVLALPDDIAVAEGRLRLRRHADRLLHYLFVVDRAGLLVGVLDIPELMRARPRQAIRDVMRPKVDHLPAWTPTAAVRTHPGWRSFHAMPVTDEAGRLVGAIRYQTLRRLERDVDSGRAAHNTTQTVGALGELFRLGMAGIIEGVATAAAPRHAGGSAQTAGPGAAANEHGAASDTNRGNR